MTTRRSGDLVPRVSRGITAEAPLPANGRPFPFIIGPEVVLEIALRQRDRAAEKAVERPAKRKRRSR